MPSLQKGKRFMSICYDNYAIVAKNTPSDTDLLRLLSDRCKKAASKTRLQRYRLNPARNVKRQ